MHERPTVTRWCSKESNAYIHRHFTTRAHTYTCTHTRTHTQSRKRHAGYECTLSSFLVSLPVKIPSQFLSSLSAPCPRRRHVPRLYAVEGAVRHRRCRRHVGLEVGTPTGSLLHRLHACRARPRKGRLSHPPHHAAHSAPTSLHAATHHFVYRVQHIPGVENDIADELSRVHAVSQLSTRCRSSIDPSPITPVLPRIQA